MLVSASILSGSIKPEVLVKKFNNTDIDYIHVDVMDGKFVKNKTYTLSEIKKYGDLTSKKLDVHLMVKNPIKYIEALALLNTEYITFHIEAIEEALPLIDTIKEYGIKVGLSINPKTRISKIFPYLKTIDMVLIMGVKPGKSGQAFIEEVTNKIIKLKEEITKNNYKTIISVDGGVNNETAPSLKEIGVDMLVSASFIHGEDMKMNIDYLKAL